MTNRSLYTRCLLYVSSQVALPVVIIIRIGVIVPDPA